MRGRFRFATHLKPFRKHRLGDAILCSPEDLLQLTSTSQKGAYTFVWSPDFCNYHVGDRSPGLEVSMVYDWSHRAIYICI